MTDQARLAALEAVADALRRLNPAHPVFDDLDALPAPQPQPAGEWVEVAVWEDASDGEYWLCRPGSKSEPRYRGLHSFTRIGTVTLPIKREREE